jgi:hypothetical protein
MQEVVVLVGMTLWDMPIISTTQVAEIRRIAAVGRSQQKVNQTSFQRIQSWMCW